MQQPFTKRGKMIGFAALALVGVVLLVAAVNKKNNSVCSDVKVEINGAGNNFFVDERQVAALLKMNSPVKGEPLANINLKVLEDRLKKDTWIAGAELFFDNENVLHVKVEEKDPVARIFTSAGNSFYIDSACNHLPLSDKLSARVPMFTNFPSDRVTLSRPDSQLMAEVKDLAMFIQADDLWKAHVEQIDITPDGFEMVPIIGNHIIVLGRGENYKEKFDRLFTFYKQVWTKVGLEKYERIDVQYNNQVVATKRGTSATKIDSATARVAFENFFAEMKKANNDTASSPVQGAVVAHQTIVSGSSSLKDDAKVQNKIVAPKTTVVKKVVPKKALVVADSIKVDSNTKVADTKKAVVNKKVTPTTTTVTVSTSASSKAKVVTNKSVKQPVIIKPAVKPKVDKKETKPTLSAAKKVADKKVPKAVMKKPGTQK